MVSRRVLISILLLHTSGHCYNNNLAHVQAELTWQNENENEI